MSLRNQLSVAMIVAAAGWRAKAQQCYVSTVPAAAPVVFNDPRAVYDTTRSRILVLDFSTSAPARLYAWKGNSWSLIDSNGPSPRQQSAATFDQGRGRLVVLGGYEQGPQGFLNDVWEWDGQSWTVIPGAPKFYGRSRHSMTYDAVRQKVFMFGGTVDRPGVITLSNDTWLWDGAAWVESSTFPRPTPRNEAALAFDSSRGCVVLSGGNNGSSSLNSTIWEWNGTWTQRTPGNVGDYRSMVFNASNNRVFFLSSFGSSETATEFNGADGAWTTVTQVLPANTGAGLLMVFDSAIGRPVVCTGTGLTFWNHLGTDSPPWIQTHPTGGNYYPGSTAWVQVNAFGSPRSYRWFRNGVPVINGGHISGAQSFRLEFNPISAADSGSYHAEVSNACRTIASTGAAINVSMNCYLSTIPSVNPSSFNSPAYAYDTARSRLVAVVDSTSNALNYWDGSRWLSVPGNPQPSRRTNTAIAYDNIRDRLVLFGGRDSQGQYPTDVWEWNGASWSSIPTQGVPGRSRHAMVFDPVRQRVVMFGGATSAGRLNDTWLWDGVSWTAPSSILHPVPRNSHAMTFDAARQRALLVGGEVGNVVYVNDFWEFDGDQWLPLPTPPPPGFHPFAESLVYDPVRNKSYRFGRTHAWAYDAPASQWTTVMQFATGCCGFAQALFDPALDGVVFPTGSGLTVWDPTGVVTPLWFDTLHGSGAVEPGSNVTLSAEVGGTNPSYQWRKNGQPLTNGGNISGVQTPQLLFTPFTAADVGTYTLAAFNECSSITSTSFPLSLISPCNPNCYANCDQSTACPVLTPNDFMCFLTAYTTAQSYADCDGVGGLTSGEFLCFWQAYNTGCP
jgi:hypothetical protein